MDQNLKERLVGAAVLIILAVIFIPMFLSDVPISEDKITETNIPEKPEAFSSRIVPLEAATESDAAETPAAPTSAETPADSTNRTETETLPEPATLTENEVPETDDEPLVTEVVSDNSDVGLTAWVVQLGSFSSEENAQSLNKQLREKKFPSFVEPVVREDSVIYRVRVGPELRRSNAEKLKSRIKSALDVDGILVQYP